MTVRNPALALVRGPGLLLLAFVSTLFASALPLGLSVKELITLESSVRQINETALAARKTRQTTDDLAAVMAGFTAVAIELDVEEGADTGAKTAKKVAAFRNAVAELGRQFKTWLSDMQLADLQEATDDLAHSWDEIARLHTQLTSAEKTYHFLQISESTQKARAVLLEIESRASNLVTEQSQLFFDRLRFTIYLLIGALLVGFLVHSIGSLGIYSSLQTAKRANAELEASTQTLVATMQQLERSNLELQSFAFIASHDLQEPLRKIEMFSGRLLERRSQELTADMMSSLERIKFSTQRMRALVTDLLAYARLDGNSRPHKSVDLNEILSGVLLDLQVRIEETAAQFECEKLPTLPADPVHMRQLFQNLISNSLKFARPGVSPVVRITTKQAPSVSGGEELVIRFSDNGIGFSNVHKDQIFKLFNRLHGRGEYEGTGVGLTTCRKIVERHRGTIDADGEPDVGATFTVRLPVG